jgi:uncharacterized protein YndB with AHSA1/START domain
LGGFFMVLFEVFLKFFIFTSSSQLEKLLLMIFLYAFAGLVVLVLIIAMLLPGKYDVEKTIIINAPASKVFDHVGDLHHFREWNPWQRMDPDPKSHIEGTPKTVGHKYNWTGKKIGVGSLTIRKVVPDTSIDFDLEFIKPWKSKADDMWTFEAVGENSCKATWRNTGELPFPVARLMGPMIRKQLNQQFEQGLNNLKQGCEA